MTASPTLSTFSGFQGRTVLLTGHTGFKGSWLAAWLVELGAKVVGVARDVPTQPSHFEAARLSDVLTDLRLDLRDPDAVDEAVREAEPDFVFHLAAQALVRRAYSDPIETYGTNVMGTIHLLEALRKLEKPCVAVLITSDKCYDNVEWSWGYRETDRLGGSDPYSGSKGAAELAIRSYVRSFFSDDSCPVRLAIGRAGNVIGGGDWAADRIVPDCVRCWSADEVVPLRNPTSTRPWQHVLEPLGGYLTLASALSESRELHGEAFNFGPASAEDHTVSDLVRQMGEHWDSVRWEDASEPEDGRHEAGLLKLNCDKALHRLGWHAVLGFADTVRFTAEWYGRYYEDPLNSQWELTRSQIVEYMELAKPQGLAWAG